MFSDAFVLFYAVDDAMHQNIWKITFFKNVFNKRILISFLITKECPLILWVIFNYYLHKALTENKSIFHSIFKFNNKKRLFRWYDITVKPLYLEHVKCR
jgi:hypothetical protein